MHNVTHEVKDGKLIITVDVSATACEAAGFSSTGKTKAVASSSGYMPVTSPKGWAVSFSLNANAKKQA